MSNSADHPRSTAKIFGHPIHPMLVPFPIVCFLGAWVTDIAYYHTAQIQWANFSAWLLAAGLVLGGLAALAGIIDYYGDKRVRAQGPATAHGVINIVAYVIELVNTFVHSRDAWTSVVPTGLTLSTIAAVLLMVSAWLGGTLTYRRRVGVAQ